MIFKGGGGDFLTNNKCFFYRTEGMSGLYRGVTPNTVGAGSAWGFYFLFYQTIKVSEYCVLLCTQCTHPSSNLYPFDGIF